MTNKEYVVDITHILPFYFDTDNVTPLNIAVKDTVDTLVEMIENTTSLTPRTNNLLVRWLTDPLSKT